MTRARLLLYFVLPGLITATLSADEVVLQNGTVYVGKTRRVGESLEITTLDGPVRVRLQDVARVRTDAELREALQKFAMRSGAGSPHAQLELARVARTFGLQDEMWLYLAKVLRAEPKSPTVRRRLNEFLAGLEREVLPVKWRKQRPDIKVRELLMRIDRRTPAAKSAAVAELLAQVPEADTHLRRTARRYNDPRRRVASVCAIAKRATDGNDRFVYRTAILDRDPSVRQAALQVSRDLGRTTAAIQYLAPGLVHDNARFRIRTAEAFGELGDVAALPHLIAAGPAAMALKRRAMPGGSTRANMSVIQQQAYIRDFDVEVAQASFIADPKVDVVQSGVVLDVTVIQVQTQRVEIVGALRNAIRRIARADPGADPAAWEHWLARRTETKNEAPRTPNR
ncbi:MAG: HEAT repeat domain-containing protein [Planctomycetes bacterium]|nr:HEAT repeat domain-containing protein [Planctomycetota bacterium]